MIHNSGKLFSLSASFQSVCPRSHFWDSWNYKRRSNQTTHIAGVRGKHGDQIRILLPELPEQVLFILLHPFLLPRPGPHSQCCF